MKRAVLTVFAAVALQGAAQGATDKSETFQFTFAGTGTHLFNFYECGGAPDPIACQNSLGGYIVPLNWSGTLSITTSDDKKGVYSGSDVSFSLASNLITFTQFLSATPVVTIDHKEIASINGGGIPYLPFFDPYTTVTFKDLSVSYLLEGCHHCGVFQVTAALTPVMTPVPEPDTYLMFLGGVALIGAVTFAGRR